MSHLRTSPHISRAIIHLLSVLPCLLVLTTLISCRAELSSSDRLSSKSLLSQSSQNKVVASLSGESRSLPPSLMCFNVNAVRVKSWHDLEFVNAVQSLSPQVLRIPGGEVANYWDWQRGGLVQNFENLPGGLPSFLKRKGNYTTGQLDSFKVLLEKTETTPLFVLNMLSSTLESQIEMLKRAEQIGLPVKEIELGNEFYLDRENYRSGFPKPEDYAQQASQWTTRIKSEFPTAQISVVGAIDKSQINKSRTRRARDWNISVLPMTLESADAATFHIYTGSGLGGPRLGVNTSSKASHSRNLLPTEVDMSVILGEPFRHWRTIKNSQSFRTVPDHKKIWITEYNLFEKKFKRDRVKPQIAGTWAHGLFTTTMSLLFLEDPRVEKICNHVLVGDSQFAAVFADSRGFAHRSTAVASSNTLGLSATGTTLKYLGSALNNATVARKIEFSGSLMVSGKRNFQYSSLYGWSFADVQGKQRSVVVNLSNVPQDVDFTEVFPQVVSFQQVLAPPQTLVTDSRILQEKTGNLSNHIVLPAYSITLLGDRE